ncbi:hypothetical protein PZB74_00730 [Porifericola rhodea]|uniref:hypothetical protein n=1 Tax=Porifericola rhodea TaxID=930972 RepID=UPI0026655DC0|nr:hypothetical protein [Porifericola rhodea]WKN31883.1 hypothetical protein PZB74_00730 [Porifericola rhodea]
MKKLIFYCFSLFVLSFTFFSCEQQELDPTAGAAKSEATLAEAEVPEGFNYSTTKKVDLQLELVYNDLPMKSEAFELYSDKELTNLLLTATTDDEGMFTQELNLPQHISTLYMKQLTEEGTENGRVASFGRIFTILLQSFTFKRCDFSEDLQLTSMCSDDPDVERRWRVRNPNDFALRFSWKLAKWRGYRRTRRQLLYNDYRRGG